MDDEVTYVEEDEPDDCVSTIKSVMMNMTLQKKGQLAKELGSSKDFPNA
jgi:hypothetical protein